MKQNKTVISAISLDLADNERAPYSLEVRLPPSSPSSDDDLLSAVGQGDKRAFALLMRRYLPMTVALAQRITLDKQDAFEIAQEAYLRVWLHANQWDVAGKATFETWLRRITINLAISYRRRKRKGVSLDTIEELADNRADGFDIVATADKKRLVHQALATLPLRQRAAVALYYFEEISQIEAAAAMQLTLRAFDSLLVRSRRNLKRRLIDLGIMSHDADLQSYVP